MALVAEPTECLEAAQRIVQFVQPRTSPENPMSEQLQQIIDAAWEDRANISAKSAPKRWLTPSST
jgi:hypothetical protein